MKDLAIKCLIILLIAFQAIIADAQQLYFYDTYHGGLTTGGYSPPTISGGTGTINVEIDPSSSVRKALLLAGRHGNAADLTVILNGNSYSFSNSNQVSPTFNSMMFGGASGVHATDVTDAISASQNSYVLEVPYQGGPSNRYNDFYLFIEYENLLMDQITTSIFVNQWDVAASVTWNFYTPFVFRTSYDIGLSLFSGYICNETGDSENIAINGNNLGVYGGADFNSSVCGGPVGSFKYQNSVLAGLGDDNANLDMSGADALSNLNSIVENGKNSLTVELDHYNGVSIDNVVWAMIAVSNSDEQTAVQEINSPNLLQVFPNPAIETATIQFTLANSQQVTINMLDVNGRVLKSFVANESGNGIQTQLLSVSEFAPGLYFIQLTTSEFIALNKLMIQ